MAIRTTSALRSAPNASARIPQTSATIRTRPPPQPMNSHFGTLLRGALGGGWSHCDDEVTGGVEKPFEKSPEPMQSALRVCLRVRLQQLFGVLERRLRDLCPAHHARHFARTLRRVERMDGSSCSPCRFPFSYNKMLVGERRDLRQVCH